MLVSVENIKCGGCANSIRKQLLAIESVEDVNVDIEQGQVSIQGSDGVVTDELRLQVLQTLLKMGYPETGSVEGLKSAGAKAKSFVSCAVGRMSDDEGKS
ncbi:MAG: heavy metal-associated domain-containing protein [Pseudomonadota bacterium]|nr:heavy metal-associated domain-containing protein [Pseudomonadota bacterium]